MLEYFSHIRHSQGTNASQYAQPALQSQCEGPASQKGQGASGKDRAKKERVAGRKALDKKWVTMSSLSAQTSKCNNISSETSTSSFTSHDRKHKTMSAKL